MRLTTLLCCMALEFGFAVAIEPARGATGAVLKTYNWSTYEFEHHPTRPIAYASLSAQDAVAVIDTNTLDVLTTIPVGDRPLGMTLSPDASRLYVANNSTSPISVIDTMTNAVVGTLPRQFGWDVEFGTGNRLFVISGGVEQIDATTGADAGPNITSTLGLSFSGGQLEISPDRTSLYYGGTGASPTWLYKIDVTSTTPAYGWGVETGSNGQHVVLSNDGTFVAHPSGSPYAIGLYRTSNGSLAGSLDTGPYPIDVAFSPDDKIAYASHTENHIDVFDMTTSASLGTILGAGSANELSVSRDGRRLFASYGNPIFSPSVTRVFDVPEPGAGAAAVLIVMAALRRRERGAAPRRRAQA